MKNIDSTEYNQTNDRMVCGWSKERHPDDHPFTACKTGGKLNDMKGFVIFETKAAWVWMGNSMKQLVKWLFRWLMRLGILVILFLIVGKGCTSVFSLAKSYFMNKQVHTKAGSPQVPSAVSQPSLSDKSGKNTRRNNLHRQYRSMWPDIRSTWSRFNNMAKDIQRFFRRH